MYLIPLFISTLDLSDVRCTFTVNVGLRAYRPESRQKRLSINVEAGIVASLKENLPMRIDLNQESFNVAKVQHFEQK